MTNSYQSLSDAISASAYVSAVAEWFDGASMGEVIVSGDGHDGMYRYGFYTSMGQRGEDSKRMTLEEISHEFPNYRWFPMGENGTWGDETAN